jgi:hypothetical protein
MAVTAFPTAHVAFTYPALPERVTPDAARGAAAETVAAEPGCVAAAPHIAAMLRSCARSPESYLQTGTQGRMFCWAGTYDGFGRGEARDVDPELSWLARFVRLAELDHRADHDVHALLVVAVDGTAELDVYELLVPVPVDPAVRVEHRVRHAVVPSLGAFAEPVHDR